MWSNFVCPLGPFLLAQSHMCNKRIVSGKNFIAIASVVYPVDVTNNQNEN